MNKIDGPNRKNSSPSTCDPAPLPVPCEQCGDPRTYVFMREPALYRPLGMTTPAWVKMPCGRCERVQLLEEERRQQDEARRKKVERLVRDTGLRARFQDKDFDDYEIDAKNAKQQSHVAFCRQYAEGFPLHKRHGTWLVLSGNVGTGKGHMLAAICREVAAQGYGVTIVKMPTLMRRIKESYDPDSTVKASQIIEALAEVDLLAIDDVGVQWGTGNEVITAYEILDTRYEDRRPTLMTTNLELDRLEKMVGPRIVDRMMEWPNKVLTFDWKSHRRKPGKDDAEPWTPHGRSLAGADPGRRSAR